MGHPVHLIVNLTAAEQIQSSIVGEVLVRVLEKYGSALVLAERSDGIVAFWEEPCHCE